MRINIITQPLFSNYGGILQNYALQEVLRRMGHEPVTINVPIKDVRTRANWKDYVKTGINLLKRVKGDYNSPFLNPHTLALKERELSFPQKEFISKYISKIDCPVPFTSKIVEANPADVWIVGSDQVWRPWCSPNIPNYFFDFLPEGTRRLAYAASFGTDRWEIAESLTPEIKRLASKFDAISVREESGVNLCKEYLGVDAKHALDPTMLLSAGDYLTLTKETDHPCGKYIATYILDMNEEKKKAMKKEAREKGLKVEHVGLMHKDGYDSIERWLSSIAHAKCVITDSFHGTVFSLIFGKPVKILKNGLRGNARLDSLLKMLNCKTDNATGYITNLEEVQAAIESQKKESMEFLKSNLSQG